VFLEFHALRSDDQPALEVFLRKHSKDSAHLEHFRWFETSLPIEAPLGLGSSRVADYFSAALHGVPRRIRPPAWSVPESLRNTGALRIQFVTRRYHQCSNTRAADARTLTLIRVQNPQALAGPSERYRRSDWK